MTLDERAPIDANTADQETLRLLPGVGPVLAGRWIAARPFETLADLTRVQGVGASTVERWRPFLTLPSAAEPDSGAAASSDVEGAAAENDDTQTFDADAGHAGSDTESRVTKLLAAKVEPALAPKSPTELDPKAGKEKPDAAPALPRAPVPEPEEPKPSEQIIEQEPPAPQEAVPGKPSARPRPAATRRYVGCMVVGAGALVLILSLALSLGILARLNDNQLQFASPAQANALALRIEGLESRADDLARDVDGLRARLNNVEAIGERMLVLEQTAETLRTDVEAMGERLSASEETSEALQTDVDAAATRVAELSAQVGEIDDDLSATLDRVDDLGTDVGTLQTESGRFQIFLEGLQALMASLFQSQGGQ